MNKEEQQIISEKAIKNESLKRKKKLTKKQQEVYDILKQHNYNITYAEIGKQLGESRQSISKTVQAIQKKGYRIEKPKLTEREQKAFDILKEHDYVISKEEIASMTDGKSSNHVSEILFKIERKGYNVRDNTLKYADLLESEEALLSINEENDYKVTLKALNEKAQIYPSCGKRLIKKFSNWALREEEAIRVAKYVKHKEELLTLLDILRNSKKISYDNIRILIDELLKYEEEDKTKGIEFVIGYENILLEKGLRRVEEPLYQLLIKHQVQLTKGQCFQISKLMNRYEEMVKNEQIGSEKLLQSDEEGPEL